MGWISQPPEVWVGLALLILIVAVITHAALSKKPDAHMEFLSQLIENLPADEFSVSRPDEPNPIPARQGR